MSASPIVWNGLVYIGTAGADWGQKARMMAYSTTDGHRVWNFDLIPTGNQTGANTWGKAAAATTGGGSTWTSYSLDTKSGLIYVPVGNPAPDFSGDYRPDANLFTDSLVVLDAKTGKALHLLELRLTDVARAAAMIGLVAASSGRPADALTPKLTASQSARAVADGATLATAGQGYPMSQYRLWAAQDTLSIAPGQGALDALVIATPFERLRYESYLNGLLSFVDDEGKHYRFPFDLSRYK